MITQKLEYFPYVSSKIFIDYQDNCVPFLTIPCWWGNSGKLLVKCGLDELNHCRSGVSELRGAE